jgi:hypothetical protein
MDLDPAEDLDELVTTARDAITVRRVFGELCAWR